ncbi:MAG: xanthine dehydrogenase molybdopterin binding subunit [Halobacteriovoraceae bacterium]|nr:xanthine dehydrogenase molybdopterin binding subunit [Halobacteriovoraceae bacterium]
MSIGKNVIHDSALGHVSGQSQYIDDIPSQKNEVYVGIVPSCFACADVKGISFEKLNSHPDFIMGITADDLHDNSWGTIVHDQPVLASQKVNYMSEPVALVVSKSRYSLQELIKLVDVDYREKKGIFTIDDAKLEKSTIYKAHPFKRGDVQKALKKSMHLLKGTFKCGGQEHFYLESQACIAYPDEDVMRVVSSSQHPSETQRVVAHALGLPLHHIVCEVKRMGGGFGGKESQGAPIAAYAAIVAKKLGKPARISLTVDEDMKITGKRHPFQNEYVVGFDNKGKITALKAHLQSDGGAYSDLSSSILERAMFHLDGAYYLENVEIKATCYKTNNHSNTAFRGFGGPQGNMTIESIIEDIAQTLGLDSYEIRKINCYRGSKNITPYGQKVENNMLPELFEKLHKTSQYKKRKKQVEEFNKKNKYKARGLSMTATKFGIAFTAKFLNQANALVNMHLDGTVQVSTGATEMGQGVNTKIQQTVASAFGIKPSSVKVMTTSTEKNHNTSATAASSGADLNCAAAFNACEMIKERLIQIAKNYNIKNEIEVSDSLKRTKGYTFKNEKVTSPSGKKYNLKDLITKAYLNRVSLGAYAHFKTKGLEFDKDKGWGSPFNYFSQGTAVSEVEVDLLTGELKVLRTDILMDLGRLINPGIDKGQTVGAFIQAMGWVTTENLCYDDKRNLLTHSPTTYKIPNIQDIPREFKVNFIQNHENKRNIFQSKAVGEPPFVLGISVWTAVKNALSVKCSSVVEMSSPATNENILITYEKHR